MTYFFLKSRIYGILEPGDDDSKYFDPFIIGLISLNIIAIILESVQPIRLQYGSYLSTFEYISVIIFTIEYILRIWSCTANPLIKSRSSYAVTPMALIDLIAIVPFYLPMVFPNITFLRILRVFRILRIFKLVRYSKSIVLFKHVFERTKGEVGFISFCIGVLIILSSSAMYLAENEAQPDKFTSIPAAMWYTVVTLSTVGYGDLYPITDIGRVIGSLTVGFGVVLVAILTGIVASGFSEELKKHNGEK